MKKSGEILIVDDQSNWRDVTKSILEASGHHVKTVASTAEAWQCLDGQSIDLIILDVQLDDENPYDNQGLKLLEQLSSRFGEQCPPIILTDFSFSENMKSQLLNVFDVKAFLIKGSAKYKDIIAMRGLIASILSNNT